MSKAPVLLVTYTIITTILLLSNPVASNRVYKTDDSIIMEGAVDYADSSLSNKILASEPWPYVREIIYLGSRPKLELPRLGNLETWKTFTHDICHLAEKDGKRVYGVCWRHPASLNILSGGSFYGTIPMTPLHLGLKQPGFNFPVLSYPITTLPKPTPSPFKENAIGITSRLSTCGAGPSKTSSVEEDRVVGGVDAAKNSWPGIVLLRLDGYFKCGGTLISPTKILTAAHCVYGLWPWDATRMTVDLGMHVLDPSDAQLVKRVKRFAHHLLFSYSTLANDIAILTLDSPVTYTSTISPVCLPPFGSSDQYTGKSASIVGWGRTSYQGPLPSVLQQATIEIVGNDQCTVSYGDVATIRSSMLCATHPGRGSCNGDSGGPLFVRSSPGAPWIQAGIVSFGVECVNDQFPSVYTRVSSFLLWIMKHMVL